ncbi:hypothetical protein MPTK2_7g11410 [Marchantia polymorpha subsp. ruderalis]
MPTRWDDLPQELQLQVLARMRPLTWLRQREVCKGWKAIIDSRDFAEQCVETWQHRPWFLVYHRCQVEAAFMYDAREKVWYRLPLGFLPVRGTGRAAAGGLLCVEESDADSFKALYVCDPVARTYTKLPPMPHPQPGRKRAVTLLVGDEVLHYKVLVGCSHRMEVYDSLSSSWRSLAPAPTVWFPSTTPVLSRDCVFALWRLAAPGLAPEVYRLFKCDPTEGAWKPVDVRMPPELTTPHLTEQGGRIMMVGGVWTENMVKSIQIWELDQSPPPAGPRWDFVAQVPAALAQLSLGAGINTSSAWSGEYLSIGYGDKLLSYHLGTKRWTVSPSAGWLLGRGLWTLVNSFRPNFAPRLKRIQSPPPAPSD